MERNSCYGMRFNLPVQPDNHEAGITEPVARFMGPMVVDMRICPGSENFYFYQNNEGQIVCITPKPPITGIDNRKYFCLFTYVHQKNAGSISKISLKSS